MLVTLTFKGTPTQFRNLVDIFATHKQLSDDATNQPFYKIVSEDEHLVEVLFRDPVGDDGLKSKETWGTVVVQTTGEPTLSHLSMHVHDDMWGDVKGAWQELFDLMIQRQFIEPDSSATTPAWEQIPVHGRARQILQMWWNGKSVEAIADKFSVQVKTIQNELSTLRRQYPHLVPTDEQRKRSGIDGK
jgi:hypothetical protein